METEKTKRRSRTHILATTLTVIFFVGSSLGVLQAQPAPTPGGAPQGAAPEGEENVICQQQMDAFLQVETGRFRDFLRTNFQNKSSTTSLLEVGVARYRELRDTVYKKYFTFFPQQGAFQLTEGLEPGACLKQVEETLAQARRELEKRATQTSTVRKTTALIGKYQQINQQLRVLNRTFLTMKAHLTTFSDKLACYTKKSCNKG